MHTIPPKEFYVPQTTAAPSVEAPPLSKYSRNTNIFSNYTLELKKATVWWLSPATRAEKCDFETGYLEVLQVCA
jgi:hypothetical protein